MPTFPEGQDPLDQGAPDPGRMPIGPAPSPDPFRTPATADTISAAFRLSNPVSSVLDAITRGAPDTTPILGYDPIPRLVGTKYEPLLEQSLGDENPAQTDARIAKFDSEEVDKQTRAASGFAGTVASVAASATDPSWFVPILGEANAARELSLGARVARGLAEGAAKSAISETALQASQVSRTPGEGAIDIATNTLLMGFLGGAAKFLEPEERAAAEKGLDDMRQDLTPREPVEPGPVNDNAPPLSPAPAEREEVPVGVEPSPLHLAQDVGAAASDKRDMQLSRIGLPATVQDAIRQLPGGSATLDWITAANMRLSPTLRVFSSGSLVAKRAMGDLAETALRFTQASRGITTAQGGVPLDRLVRMQQHEGQLTGSQILRDQFVAYRGITGKLPMAQTALADARGLGGGKLSFDAFKKEVSLAASNGDAHAIPEVATAAQQIRTKVLDPIKSMAQRVMGPDGRPMLAEAMESPKGDKSFFPRLWNKTAMASGRNRVKKIFADWLESEQAVKAAAKERIARAQEQHEKYANIVDRLDGRIETNKARQVDTAAQLKERGMETNRATDREYTLYERNDNIDARVDELEQFLAETKSEVQSHEADEFDREQYDNLKREVANLKASKGRNNIRLNEAGIPVSANQSRFMDLADRMTRQQVMDDLLAKARANAEDMRVRLRGKMEDEIRGWKGNATGDAVSALKARDEAERIRGLKQQAGIYEGKGGRFTAADGPVDRAVKSILASDRDLSREELESRAAEIIDRINAAPDGRIPYDVGSGGPQMGPPGAPQNPVAGSLNSRDFAIPTHLVKDFIETDAEHVIAAHLRTAIPDIHLTDRFGDVEMQDVFRRLNEEYDAKANAIADPKKLTALDNERKAMNRDLAATRDRLRGVYGWELAKGQPNAARIANAARNYNLIADLGTSVFNRMNDATNAVWRYGLSGVFADGYVPFFKSLVGMDKTFLPTARQSMADMGVGVDSAIGHLSHQFGDVISNVKPGSKFERALAWSASKAMMVNLHGPWTDGIKTIAGTVAAANLLRTAERVALGTATAGDIAQLARSGIEPGMASRIWQAYKGGGGQEFGKGTHVANTAAWTDSQARQIFTSAIGRDADMSVLNPGMEKPLWMSGPVVSLLGQYKSFVAAAHEKILISNLQQMDGHTLQGLVASLGMGMLSYRAYTLLEGAPASDRPQDWIKEAISRSAMLGWFTEINSMQAKFTGGATDAFRAMGADHPLSRRSSNGALSEMLGPTYAKLEGLAGGLNDASHGTWTATDTHKLRQAMFLQNLFAIRGLLNDVEDGFNEHLGVKPLNRGPGPYPNTVNTQP